MKSVYSAVWTGSLYIIKFNFDLLNFKHYVWILRFDSQNKSNYFILALIPGRKLLPNTEGSAEFLVGNGDNFIHVLPTV